MKYIKEYYNHSYHYEIDSEKYNDSLMGRDEEDQIEFIQKNWISITKEEILKISEIFPQRKYTLNSYVVKVPKNSSMTISYITFTKSYYIMINKVKDEWFYVEILNTYGSVSKYYACDQFDGLVNCLLNLYKSELYDEENKFDFEKDIKLKSDNIFESRSEVMYKEISESQFSELVLFYSDEVFSFFRSRYNFDLYSNVRDHINPLDKFTNHLMTTWDPFTEEEIKKIVSTLQVGFLQIWHYFPEVEVLINDFARGSDAEDIPKSRLDIFVGTTKKKVFLTDSTIWANGLIIIKLKDEWYYVATPDGEYHNSNSYYKCDQFEGLLAFLEMMIDKTEV